MSFYWGSSAQTERKTSKWTRNIERTDTLVSLCLSLTQLCTATPILFSFPLCVCTWLFAYTCGHFLWFCLDFSSLFMVFVLLLLLLLLCVLKTVDLDKCVLGRYTRFLCLTHPKITLYHLCVLFPASRKLWFSFDGKASRFKQTHHTHRLFNPIWSRHSRLNDFHVFAFPWTQETPSPRPNGDHVDSRDSIGMNGNDKPGSSNSKASVDRPPSRSGSSSSRSTPSLKTKDVSLSLSGKRSKTTKKNPNISKIFPSPDGLNNTVGQQARHTEQR